MGLLVESPHGRHRHGRRGSTRYTHTHTHTHSHTNTHSHTYIHTHKHTRTQTHTHTHTYTHTHRHTHVHAHTHTCTLFCACKGYLTFHLLPLLHLLLYHFQHSTFSSLTFSFLPLQFLTSLLRQSSLPHHVGIFEFIQKKVLTDPECMDMKKESTRTLRTNSPYIQLHDSCFFICASQNLFFGFLC
jgi:uncharacterized Rmd1/YagE family protein